MGQSYFMSQLSFPLSVKKEKEKHSCWVKRASKHPYRSWDFWQIALITSVPDYVVQNHQSLKLKLQLTVRVLRQRLSLKAPQPKIGILVTIHKELERANLHKRSNSLREWALSKQNITQRVTIWGILLSWHLEGQINASTVFSGKHQKKKKRFHGMTLLFHGPFFSSNSVFSEEVLSHHHTMWLWVSTRYTCSINHSKFFVTEYKVVLRANCNVHCFPLHFLKILNETVKSSSLIYMNWLPYLTTAFPSW